MDYYFSFQLPLYDCVKTEERNRYTRTLMGTCRRGVSKGGEGRRSVRRPLPQKFLIHKITIVVNNKIKIIEIVGFDEQVCRPLLPLVPLGTPLTGTGAEVQNYNAPYYDIMSQRLCLTKRGTRACSPLPRIVGIDKMNSTYFIHYTSGSQSF